MITINYSYTFGVNFPVLFDSPKVGDRLIHSTHGAATIHEVEGEHWFVVEYANSILHRERFNIEGSSFNGLEPRCKPIKPWDSYAWPGGYPIYHLTQDGGILCPDCANENLALTHGDDPQWKIVHSDVNWEDENCNCDNCYKPIESAYGGD